MTSPAPATVHAAMRRALELAGSGPATGANPQVGCVILSPTGETLAEGWHRGAGTPHAEADALSKLRPGRSRGATAVVTLEPCNHTGHTPPCSRALLDAGIAHVYFAVADPNPVAHGGADCLRRHGVPVTGGILAAEVTRMMRPWLTAMRLGRPYVTLKWASSLDGRTAAADGSSKWITGPAAREHAHRRRSLVDAILVGTGTVLADDPALTARGADGGLLGHQPIPVVVGGRTLPGTAKIFSHPQPAIITGTRSLPLILEGLFARGLRRVLVEGGPTLASAFVAAGLVDEYLIYLAPTLLGGPRTAITDIGVGSLAQRHDLILDSAQPLGEDLVIVAHTAPDVASSRSAVAAAQKVGA